MIKYCKGCLNPSTRPNTFFNKNGFCPVCVYEDSKTKQKVDWPSRKSEINQIKKWGKENSKSTHDCIVTVSGGKDSMRQAFYVRDDLKMNPLLIACVYPPEQLHERGADNLSNLIEHGFDCISVSLDPQKWKELMSKRPAVEKGMKLGQEFKKTSKLTEKEFSNLFGENQYKQR